MKSTGRRAPSARWRWPRRAARRPRGRSARPPAVSTNDGIGVYSPVAALGVPSPPAEASRAATAARSLSRRCSRTACIWSVDGADWTQRTSAPSSIRAPRGRSRRARAPRKKRRASGSAAPARATSARSRTSKSPSRQRGCAPRGAARCGNRGWRGEPRAGRCPRRVAGRGASPSSPRPARKIGPVIERVAGDLLRGQIGELALEHGAAGRAHGRATRRPGDAEVAELHRAGDER